MLKLSKQFFTPRTIIADKARDSEQREKVAFFSLADVVTATHEYQMEVVTTASIIGRGNCNFWKAQSYFRRIFLMLESVQGGSNFPGSKCHLEGGVGKELGLYIHPSNLTCISSALLFLSSSTPNSYPSDFLFYF